MEEITYEPVKVKLERQKSSYRDGKPFACTYENIHKLLTNDNVKQKLQSFLIMIIELFKMSMACLLSIFVPQNCNGNICSTEENFKDLTSFNIGVIAFNFVTLFIFILAYVYEYKREIWMITNLDNDNTIPDNSLEEKIKSHPEVKRELELTNKIYIGFQLILAIFIISNFVLSSVLVFHYYYYDYKTITTMITNLLLVYGKITENLGMSIKCYKNNSACSAYLNEKLVFNTLDKKKYSEKNTKSIEITVMVPVKKSNIVHPAPEEPVVRNAMRHETPNIVSSEIKS